MAILTFARPIMPIVSWHTKPTTVTVSLPRRRTACHSPNISFSLIEIPCCLILSSIILRKLAVPWQASSDSESDHRCFRDRYSSCCSLGSCACEHAIGTAAHASNCYLANMLNPPITLSVHSKQQPTLLYRTHQCVNAVNSGQRCALEQRAKPSCISDSKAASRSISPVSCDAAAGMVTGRVPQCPQDWAVVPHATACAALPVCACTSLCARVYGAVLTSSERRMCAMPMLSAHSRYLRKSSAQLQRPSVCRWKGGR